MKNTYYGSCHCGAVQFECELDLATSLTSRCNCSICRRGRYWKTLVPEAEFRLVKGKDALTEYMWGGRHIHHFFCKVCGIKPFGRVYLDMTINGQTLKGDYYAINLMCLENVTDEELVAAPIRFEDGRNNDWDHAPAVTSHL
jgi:hypothetical protein